MPSRREILLVCLCMLVMIFFTACSDSGSSTNTTPNNSATTTVTVSPTTASVPVGTTKQFTATVANAANTTVTWQVNGVAGGNATVGTISSSGLYTAPASVPSPATVTVTAVSQADSSKSASATVTVTVPPPITVSVAPPNPTVAIGATQQFTATVTGTSNTAVTWQVNNVAGGNATVGTISAAGLYTAPSSVPSPATVTVTAISSADNTKTGSATVTISAVAATARFVYVSSFPDDKIAVFSVNDTTGLLTPNGSASVPTGSNPSFLKLHPNGKFLYSLNNGTGDISIFSVNSTTGALTAAGSAAAAAAPLYMVISPNGSFAYVTCDAQSFVLGYSVNTTTGALTALPGSPFAITGSSRIKGVAITPDGKYLYVSDRDATPNGIYGFSINSGTGALTAVTGSPFPGEFMGTLIVDKLGKFLYSGSPDDSVVSGYSINSATGALTFVNDYDAGTMDVGVWTFDPTGTYLYGGSNGNDNVFGLKEAADGSLTGITGMPVNTAVLPNGGGVHPNGKFGYVVSTISETTITPGTITIYSINATTGAWTQINSMGAGVNNTIGFAITP